ncbi:hypothetical protein C0991_009731, partial [Blastosporella zonata]
MPPRPFQEIKETATRRIIDATVADKPSLSASYVKTDWLYNETSDTPVFLDTLIVAENNTVLAFSEHNFAGLRSQSGSDLLLPLQTIVHTFFITDHEIHKPGTMARSWVEYRRGLHGVMKTAQVLGIAGDTAQLLDNALSRHDFRSDPAMDSWKCRQLVIFGLLDYWRWTSLRYTRGGEAYLSIVTHLTIWVDEFPSEGDHNGLPSWVKDIPFKMMKNLTCFACPVADSPGDLSGSHPTQMNFYETHQP